MIEVVCGGCGTRLRAPDDKAGLSAQCPKCSLMVSLPLREFPEVHDPPPKPPPAPSTPPTEQASPTVKFPGEPPDAESPWMVAAAVIAGGFSLAIVFEGWLGMFLVGVAALVCAELALIAGRLRLLQKQWHQIQRERWRERIRQIDETQ